MKFVKLLVPDTFEDDYPNLKVWEPEYRDILDHGFLGLVDWMGDDSAVVQAARVSYGKGTKKVSEDRGLIRYLIRHSHWTPIEMAVFKWHIKLPIFVERQMIRHRTASVNEASGRYSIMDDEMYVPAPTDMAPQSKDNKQGRNGFLTDSNASAVRVALEEIYEEAYQTYQYLLGETQKPADPLNMRRMAVEEAAMAAVRKLQSDNRGENPIYPEWVSPTPEMIDDKIKEYYAANDLMMVDSEYPGLARELARICLPVATYTQKYWMANLRNTMNFLQLRTDPHAQKEIRLYADMMLDMLTPYVPFCMEAFVDYQQKGAHLSRMEIETLRDLLKNYDTHEGDVYTTMEDHLKAKGVSQREIKEFLGKLE